jgi:tagatose 1,6-diphosphate aldolase
VRGAVDKLQGPAGRERPTQQPERSLLAFRTPAGAICALALDHRDALRNAFRRLGEPDPSERSMLELKARVLDALGDRASTLLLDPPALRQLRPDGVGLLVPLEEQGHDALAGGRVNRLLDGFGPAQAKALGAHGCKLLLYYRADHLPTADRQLELVARVAAGCHDHGLPLVVEPLVYRLETESGSTYVRRLARLIVAAAEDLSLSGADLLKLQYAGSRSLCEKVTEAAAPLPWTLLGGSDTDGETFAAHLELACAAGAYGFVAGRPIWGGALGIASSEQSRWLRTHARPLLERLADTADTHARRTP